MLPSIDFTQQLSQIQAQLASLAPQPAYTPPNTAQGVPASTVCPHRLPCGLCAKTNSFCGMQTTESEVKTDEQ